MAQIKEKLENEVLDKLKNNQAQANEAILNLGQAELRLVELKAELEAVNKKIDGKETEALKKKAEKLNADIEAQNTKIEQTEAEKTQVIEIFKKYYETDKLKSEFAERTDTELINHFKNGLLSRYKSDDIVLRTSELLTILDNIRKDIVWE